MICCQPKGGVEGGPALIRAQGLNGQLQQMGFHVKDYGDMEFTYVGTSDMVGAGVKNPKTVGNAMKKVGMSRSLIIVSCMRIGLFIDPLLFCFHFVLFR